MLPSANPQAGSGVWGADWGAGLPEALITCCSSVRGSGPRSLLCKQRPASPQEGCCYLLSGRLLLTHRGHCGKWANETLAAGLTPRLPSSPAGRGLALRLRGPSSAPPPAGARAPALGAEAPPPRRTALTMLHLNLPPPTARDSPLTYNSWDVQMGATLNSASEKRTWSPTATR